MSTSPIATQIVDQLKSFSNRILEFVWPVGSAKPFFIQGAVRGATVAVALIALLVAPLALAFSSSGVADSLSSALLIAIVLSVGATGASVNFAPASFGLESNTVVEWGIHPTFLTLGLVLIAYFIGRKFGRENAGTAAARFHAFGLGAGFAIPIAFVYASAYGLVDVADIAQVALAGPSFANVAIIFAVVAVPSWVAAFRAQPEQTISAWQWAFAALGRFFALYAVLASAAIVAFLVVNLIEPDFAHSAPQAELDLGLGARETTMLIVGFVLFVPTLLVSALFLSMGAESKLLLSPSADFSVISEWVQSVNPAFATAPSVSVAGTFGWWIYPVIFVFVGLLASIAGISAALKLGYQPRKLRDLLLVIGSVVVSIYVIHSFTTMSLKWTPAVSEVLSESSPAVTLPSSFVEFGVTLGSLFALSILVSVAIYFGTQYATHGLRSAFPRTTNVATGATLLVSRNQFAAWSGRAFIGALILCLAVPLSVATAERIWGATDSPSLIGAELSELVNAGDVESLVSRYDTAVVGADEWIDAEVMAVALSALKESPSISVVNESGDQWEVGNTDAIVNIEWPLAGGNSLEWSVSTSSSMTRLWDVIDHAVFNAEMAPARVNFQLSEFLIGAEQTTVEINGVAIESGEYALLPGVYTLVSPAYKLLAASNQELVVTSTDAEIVIGNQISLPEGGEAKLEAGVLAAAKRCAAIDTKGASKCFTSADVVKNADVVSGTAPKNYYSQRDVAFRLGATDCGTEAADKLTTASSMTRTVECTQVVTYSKQFTKAQNVRIPIQSCDIDWDAWYQDYDSWDPYDYEYCWTSGYRYEQVEGPVVATVKYSATIPFTVTVTGTLDAANRFGVK
ncbi:hypothetical protein C8A06_0221 [Microbacteriaceae bacterium MWH-Ta3]|nr:hypothetical protein C8A06_0221 [Microbacteriaceae bacterium MWH-Ta3]